MNYADLVALCKSDVYLTVNEHEKFGETLDEWITCGRHDEEDQAELRKLDPARPIWILQWYPETSVGFYLAYGNSEADVLAKAAEIMGVDE